MFKQIYSRLSISLFRYIVIIKMNIIFNYHQLENSKIKDLSDL